MKTEGWSWKQDDEETISKPAMLTGIGLLLILLTAVFLYLISPSRGIQVFMVSLSITEYGERIPKLRYGEWSSESWVNKNFNEWTRLPVGKYQNQEHIKKRVDGLSKELDGKGLNAKDTVIVQLRSHASVDYNTQKQSWRCGLPIGEEAETSLYPIEDALRGLCRLRAKNVVLVADICELKSVPHRGWIINPLVEYLLMSCKEVEKEFKGKQHPDIWILCAAADSQPTFYSDKQKKTLFQEAAEETLKRAKNDHDLSLAQFYESILRYCHEASDGRQTPLLISGKQGVVCKPDNETEWKKTETVTICRRNNFFSRAVESDKSETKTDEKSAEKKSVESKKRRIFGKYVVFQNATSDPSAENANKFEREGAVETEPKAKKEIDSKLYFQFWQGRDDLLSPDDWRWTPIEYSPFLWRRIQSERAAYVIPFELNDPKWEPLTGIHNLPNKQNSVGRGGSNQFGLASALNHFLNEKDYEGIRKMWENDSSSSTDSVAPIRMSFRNYTRMITDLVFWRDLIDEFSDGEMPKNYENLQGKLMEARKHFSEDPKVFPYELLRNSELKKFRDSLYKSLESKLKAAEEIKFLSWKNERLFQVLFASPLLSYEDRKPLHEKYTTLIEESFSSVIGNSTIAISTLIPQSDQATPAFRKRIERTRDVSSFYFFESSNKLPAVPDDSEAMLEWGKDYLLKLKNSGTTLPKFHQWHLLSLVELDFSLVDFGMKDTDSCPGIVLAPSNPKEVRVNVASKQFELSSQQNSNDWSDELSVEVKHADGTDAEELEVKWISLPPTKAMTDFRMTVVTNETKQITLNGPPVTVKPKDKEITFRCEYVGRELLNINDPEIDFEIKTGDLKVHRLTVPVTRISNEIELVMLRDGIASPIELKTEDGFAGKFELENPAVTGAYSLFKFQLKNRKKQDRSAEFNVFCLPKSELEQFKNGNRSAEEIWIATSGRVLLQKSGETSSALDVSLSSPPSATQIKPIENIADRALIFKIDEYEVPSDKTSESKILRNKSVFYLGEFKPRHPYDEVKLVEIDPASLEQGEELHFEIKPNTELFNRYDIAKLKINSKVTSTLPNFPGPSSDIIELDRAGKSKRLKGPTRNIRSDYHFELAIGDYPRAIQYKIMANMKNVEENHVNRSEIVEILPRLKSRELDEKIKVKEDAANRLIFPHRTSERNEIKYEGIDILTKTDLTLGSKATLKISKFENRQWSLLETLQIDQDRIFDAKLTCEQSGLKLGFNVRELTLFERKQFADAEGTFKLELSCDSSNRSEKVVVFDRTPPEKCEIKCDQNTQAPRLYLDKDLELWVAPKDAPFNGAGIEGVRFNFDNNIHNQAPMNGQREGVTDKFKVKISSAQFKNRSDEIIPISVQTFDRAGNWQEKNEGITIQWINKPSPNVK